MFEHSYNMTSPAIEARSLSSLTALASNPPSYPRNPTHVKNEPLVLYIARVPGSRDVFLTPIKPRDKVVTAEDVQSSLYYLHIDQPEDVRLIQPALESENVPRSPNGPKSPRIPRKALPNQASQNVNLVTPSPPLPELPEEKLISGLAIRNDVEARSNHYAGNYSQHLPTHPLDVQDKQRLPLDPIRQWQEQQAPHLPPRHSVETEQQLPKLDNGPNSRYYQPGTGSQHLTSGYTPFTDPFASNQEALRNDSSSSAPPPPRLDKHAVGSTTLTLIRRDPASGAQWNVARIEDPPVAEISSHSSNEPSCARKKRTGTPLYIEVTNPGYSKFLNIPERPFSLISRASDLSTMTLNMGADIPATTPLTHERVFRRRLWMEGSRYSDRTFGHRKNSSYDSGIGRGAPLDGSESWTRERQEPNALSPEPHFLTTDDQAYSSIQISNKPSSFRGYVFLSPWNGRCEFSTGGGGTSLKCRHFLPGTPGSSTPPPATISELRFNLPTSARPATSRGEESKRPSFLHRPRHGRNNSSLSDIRYNRSAEDVKNQLDRMDLSLGQEFAGGGFGGKQAKLGKLILEDEGLKMADVLVAANLALWWRAYDKVDERTRSRSSSLQS